MSSLYHNPFVRNLHKLESLTPYTNCYNQNGVRKGVEMHTRAQRCNNTHTSKKRESTNQNDKVTTKNVPKSLSNKSTTWS
jgi:hypothetical protein